jgi:hypothetical protein
MEICIQFHTMAETTLSEHHAGGRVGPTASTTSVHYHNLYPVCRHALYGK